MTNDRTKKTVIGWATQPSLDRGQGAYASASPSSYPQDTSWPHPPNAGYAPYPGYPQPAPPVQSAYAPNHAAPLAYAPQSPQAAYPRPAHAAYPPHHAPAQPVYPSPSPTYAASPSAYAAPPPAYAAPSPAYAPPSPAYAAPPSAYAAPSPVYAPPPSGYPVAPSPSPAYGGTSAEASLYAAQQLPRAYAAAPPAAAPPDARGETTSKTHRTLRKADIAVGKSQRVRFIRLTYLHLLGSLGAFAGLLYLFMTQEVLVTRVSVPLVTFALGGRANWGVVLAVFVAISWVADYWASHASSRAVQYAGLAFYVLAEALIFIPLLAIVEWKTRAILARGGAEPHIVRDAAYVTLGIFTALTASVFVSNKDFSFLRSGLAMASGAALSLIVLSLTFGFNLGLAFSVGMVLLAAGYVLYQTSQVLAHYDPRQHVAAALALFGSPPGLVGGSGPMKYRAQIHARAAEHE